MTAVAVLGAGSWGTALANHLAGAGADVVIWSHDPEVARAINSLHQNPLYLPGAHLAPSLRATASAADAVRGRPVIVSVSPSQTVRSVLAPLADAAQPDAVVIGASKGIETSSLKRMSEVCAEALPNRPYVILSGPSFAEEVVEKQPTAVVAASASAAAATLAQQLFSTSTFRVYTSGDVTGTELAGSFKNVIAIAAGMLDGLGLGNNPRAALITRGLAEITRLGAAMGADPRTFAGLAGVGDLVLTTCGTLSRNRALGVALGTGQTLAEFSATNRSVVEGVYTARVAMQLSVSTGVEMPIAAKVAECLFDGKPPRQAIAELMERTPKPEQWT
ncbi:MAG: NAD(P)-dependent glycerol-3-phosphate dehydrogenase [Gemmatimonadales bacterium]|nr:NAD(P)-dependent glycerol-3-phosphate dehydrogenase [Gemmatimonadales bacterium]